jgi:putative aldouronate transport system permease protein
MSKRNPNKIKEGSSVATFLIHALLVLLALICIYPIWYTFIISLSTPLTARTLDVFLLPDTIYLGSYEQTLADPLVWSGYANTILYAGSCCVGMLVTCAMTAYPLTSPLLVGKKIMVWFILIPMYFGGGLIPTFLWMNKLGLYDTRWAIILPGMVSMWYIILVRTFFASIPEELRESARIDGANNYQILFNVYVPTSKPIMAVIAIYTIVAQWNSYFAAMVYLTTQNKQPLQLYLRRMLILQQQAAQAADGSSGQGGTSEGAEEAMKMALSADQLKYTIIVVSTLPMLIVYPFLQKYFVKGVMVGSLKG